jgi:MarR family transcriptional regulator, 2-MHQ and catechol-resistance regulon repressor
MLLVEVQRRVLVSSGGITYLVDRLARKGLVERRPCSHDRRAAYAALTPSGERLIAELFPAHAEAIVHAVAGLTDVEKRQAIRLLKKLGIHAAETPPLAAGAQAAGHERTKTMA